MKFLKLLKKLRNQSDHPTHRHSCVIAKGNQIISIGYNKYKTSPKSNHPYKYIHAELSAILDNQFNDLAGTTAYIYRERNDGTPALSKPCKSCVELLKIAKIKKICYSIDNGFEEEYL